MAENTVDRWGIEPNHGPVLSQTDLDHLPGTKLDLHPILENTHPTFHSCSTCRPTGGYNPNDQDHDLPFSQKNEPATLPRVARLIVICERTPWCTVVENECGVTLDDVCQAIWKDYTDNDITEEEMLSLSPRIQDGIRRFVALQAQTSALGRLRRIDWVRERMYFEGLVKEDELSQKRLGVKAPNVFGMVLSG